MRISALGTTVFAVLLTLGAGCAAEPQPSPAGGTQLEGTPYIDDTPQEPSPAPTSAAPAAIETAQAAEIGAVKNFTVTGDNFAYDLKEIKVKKGDKVRITFKNAEGFHDFRLDAFSLATAKLSAGAEETLEFTADKAGVFEYYCSVGQHRKMGMKGELIVE